MVAPINYMAGAADPSQIIAQGYQMGIAGAQSRQDAQLREAQANKLRVEAQRQQKMQADLAALQSNENPTAADYSRIVTAYPELADPMKKAWEVMDSGQQKANISLMSQALSAVKSGKPEIAQQLLTDQATALRNSGKENEAKASETWAKLITIHPEMAVNTANMALASVMDPKEFAATYDKMNSSDAQAAKAKADAMTATVTAQNAPLAQQLDMQKVRADIVASQASTENARLANQIKLLEAQQAKSSDALKKEELALKVKELKTNQENAVNQKVAEYESAMGTIDNTLSQLAMLESHPGKKAAVGTVDPLLPSVLPDTVNFEALLKTLDSQVFLSQLPAMKGLGALTDKEGEKLQTSFQTLTARQSVDQFDKNLAETKRLLIKARDNAATKYGLPKSAPDIRPDVKPQGSAAPTVDNTKLFQDADAILGL